MREQGTTGVSVFLAVAIVEHLILTLVLALAVYTEPTLKPDDTPVKVDILIAEPERKRIEGEIPIAIPPTRRIEMPEKLPPIQSTSNVQRYLDSTRSTSGLPDLPPSRTTNRNSDRFSLGAPPSQGRNRTLLDESEATNATVRGKPLTDQTGPYGASERPGVPNVEKRQKPTGGRGQSLTGNVSVGRTIPTGPNRVTGGAGFELEISGEVSGRGYRLGKPIQTEGKQGGGVQLSFKVRPDGTVFDVRIQPGRRTTVGEVRLKEQARRYVERMRFDTLPKGAAQVNQSAVIFINFTTQTNP
ncbi:MAG: hypothetical protein O7E52_17380 [Candidatus Poribacteria bacterium]|nr:hypothetical protein [Candidatus Poribacteria bacterium]